jgi:hypothetical protein
MRLIIAMLALALLACDPLPPRRLCHLQTIQVRYLPAHPCTKIKATSGGFDSYQGFCDEQCNVVTSCTLWCDQLDAANKNVEKHPAHPTILSNVGSNSIRCDEQGHPVR